MTYADDQFKRFFTEKIWAMIPSIYRHEDGLGKADVEAPYGVLHALVEVWAEQAAILRRSQDQLWDDQFIDLCSDWVVPYLADLLGTRMLSALDKRGRRIDVAKTIYYRRRKGTPLLLEELISDIGGWDGKLVENFRRLGRARHGLDPHPAPLAGRLTGTMPGGWANLRQPHGAELTDGPFDEFHHTPDMRRNRGRQGRYGIPKISFYLYRLTAYRVEDVTPYALADGLRYTFDPSGRSSPLFSRRLRANDWEQRRAAREWEVQAPIRCRLLADAHYQLTEELIQLLITNGLSNPSVNAIRPFRDWPFRSESDLRATLGTLPAAVQAELLALPMWLLLLRHALLPACGKAALLPNSLAVDAAGNPDPDTGSLAVATGPLVANIVTAEHIAPASLQNWPLAIALPDKQLAIDAEQGRFQWLAGAVGPAGVQVNYHYGFSGLYGAGTYSRPLADAPVLAGLVVQTKTGGGPVVAAELPANGLLRLTDSRTYGPIANKAGIRNLTVLAASQQRPYLRLDADWRLRAAANTAAKLTLDGLWLGSAPAQNRVIVLQGNYDCVIIRNCTLDPGGDQTADGQPLRALSLVIEGTVKTLCIDHAIVGPIALRGTGLLETLVISDSVVQSTDAAVATIQLPDTNATITRTTIFGDVALHTLSASEVIATGLMVVRNTQTGCFRFSAALRERRVGLVTTPCRLPRPYQSLLFTDDTSHWFGTRQFGQPAFAQLTESAPEALRRGAENGGEMGVFSQLLTPIKLDSLTAKLDEYVPFGLTHAFIFQS